MKSVTRQFEETYRRLVFPADSSEYLRLLAFEMFTAGRRSIRNDARRQAVARNATHKRKEPKS